MSEKHTPGPLKASGNGVHTARGACVFIAYDPAEISGKRDIEVIHANARLGAAAPDLLEACRPVLNEAKQREDYMHDTWNPDAHVELTLTIAEIRAIHDAVAKAKGAHG